jgi:hypothetical protein
MEGVEMNVRDAVVDDLALPRSSGREEDVTMRLNELKLSAMSLAELLYFALVGDGAVVGAESPARA